MARRLNHRAVAVVEGGPADVAASSEPGDEPTASIEGLAAAWLEAERLATSVGNANNTEDRARQASSAYTDALAEATAEDLLLAWHAASEAVADTEMGSKAWAEAREVAELLRVEYLAARS